MDREVLLKLLLVLLELLLILQVLVRERLRLLLLKQLLLHSASAPITVWVQVCAVIEATAGADVEMMTSV